MVDCQDLHEVSLVSRKVNGVTFRHILQLFFREYSCLHALANAFALPLGIYGCKKPLLTKT